MNKCEKAETISKGREDTLEKNASHKKTYQDFHIFMGKCEMPWKME
jgi:hypothetical protein